MAPEKSSTSEGNINSQTASENIYDIFGTSPDTTDVDDKESWVDKCHQCLRFFFCIFLFIFVLATALISRLTFHILLINLNPPTIFTTMNKFGGDTGNTTAPFLPAQVHISWIWGCFLVLVAPSLHSFVYHTGQFCRKRDLKVVDADEKKQRMIFLTQSSNAARVSPNPTNGDSQELNTTTVESQTNRYTVKECDINIRIELQWLIIIALSSVQAICEIVAVFVILPTFDQATASIIVVFMTIATPTLLNGIINPYFYRPKKCINTFRLQNISKALSFLLYVGTLVVLLLFVYLVSTKGNETSPVNTLVITAIITVLLSVGFWENLSGFHFERFNKRTLLMILLSLIKLIVMFVTLLLTFLIMGGTDGVSVLFNGISNATITLLDKNILLVNTLPFNGDCSFLQPMMTGLTSFMASYECYKLSYYTCRTYLQRYSFAPPLVINILVLPFIVHFTFKSDIFYANINGCSIISKEWDFIVDKGNTTSKILIIFCGALTFCQVIFLTTYIWRRGMRIAKLEKLFAMPFYAAYAVDITLFWSRRRNIERQMYNTKSETTTSQTIKETSATSQKTETKKECKVKMIPFIYLCATIWHETELEMKTLLRSVFRLNKYQWKMTCRQHLLMQKKKIKHPEETYFQFEAHIFFDDAFKENKEKVKTGESKANKKKFNKIRGKEVNEFVKQFIKCVEETSRSYYNVKTLGSFNKFTTPYGARLEWDLQSPPEETEQNIKIEDILAVPCRLILHLKDKFLIRNKKRWSQVMYMYYLLSYIPMVKKTDLLESNKQDNEQPSTSSTPLNNRDHQQEVINDLVEKEQTIFKTEKAPKTFILALDGDVDFKPDAVLRLLERMLKNPDVGAACGRIIPMGRGPVVWYQSFEYAVSHWLQKATEHVFGCVLCSPGCFSLFRASALMSNDVIKIYTRNPTSGLECIQYDQGEDRWLSTLLLNKGFKIEYTAASDAYTYVPEGFFEFFNQRRRWSPSTLANIFKIISNISSVSKENVYITRTYLLYHTFLFVSSFITPGTIFLMILGATYLAFPEIPLWIAFVINLLLVSIVMLSCLFAEQKTQLNIIAVISSIYALMMIVVLFGLILDAIRSEFCSVTTYFFIYVAGIFFLSAVLHPREFINIVHGALYFLAVPTTSMLMLIYALGNLHVTSWGTRESNKTRKRKNQAVDDSLDFCSCFGLWRCICMPPKTRGKTNSKETKKVKSTTTKDPDKPPKEVDTQLTQKEEDILEGAVEVEEKEKQFWKDIIKSYLSPDVKEVKELKEDLKSFRNGVYAGFIMINLIYITIVFVVTQANELNDDVFAIRLPCPNKTGTFDVDPISVVLSITFGLVLFFQFIGMLIHRFSTFTHIVAVSKISCKNPCKKDTGDAKRLDNFNDATLKHDTAALNIFQGINSNIPENLKAMAPAKWKKESEKVPTLSEGSLTSLDSNENSFNEKEPISLGGSLLYNSGYRKTLLPINQSTEKKKKKKKKKKSTKVAPQE